MGVEEGEREEMEVEVEDGGWRVEVEVEDGE